MYLGAVMIYSVAALAVALPLTVVVAGGIASFLGTFINIDFPRWVLSPTVVVIQLAIGLLVPLLAAVQPVRKGSAITVREAVSDYGTGNTTLNEGLDGASAGRDSELLASVAILATQYVSAQGPLGVDAGDDGLGRHALHDGGQCARLVERADRVRSGLLPV